MASADLVIRVLSDTKKVSADFKKASADAKSFGDRMKAAAVPAAAAGAGLLALGGIAAKAASDLQQSQGAVESVFGKSSKAVEKFASTSAERLGVARSEYLNSAALMGSALQNAGFKAAQAADQTDKAFSRSADLAATFGGTAAEAMDAINAAVSRGEFDPLEKYAISLNATAINAELAKRGQDKLTGAALKNAKAQASLDLIYQQSNKVSGQFAREADTAAGAQQRAAAAAKDAAADLGTALLPVVAALATHLAAMARWAAQNKTTVTVLAVAVGALVVAVLAVNAAMAVAAAATTVYTAAQKLATAASLGTRIQLAALTAQEIITNVATKALAVSVKGLRAAWLAATGPVGLVVIAVAALVAIFIVAYKKSETFRNIVNAALGAVKNAAAALGRGIAAIPGYFSSAFDSAKNKVTSVGGAIVGVVTGLPGKILGVLRGLVDSVPSVVGAAMTGALNRVKSIGAQIPGALSGLAGAMVSAGRNIIAGLISGIRAMAGDAASAAIDVVKGALDKAKGWLHIGSPSKRVRDEIGKQIGAGLVEGIVGGKEQVKAAMTDLVKAVRDSGSKALVGIVADANDRLLTLAGKYEKVTDKLEAVKDRLKTLKDQAAQLAGQVKDTIVAAGDISGIKGATTTEGDILPVTFQQILDAKKAAADQAAAFGQTIQQLRSMGLSEDQVQQLLAKGPEALEVAQAMAQAGAQGIAALNALQTQIVATGTQVGEQASTAMYGSGIAAAQGLINALQEKEGDIAKAMKRIARQMVKALREALDIKSPSRLMAQLGSLTGEGFIQGLSDQTKAVAAAGASLVDPLVNLAPVIPLPNIDAAAGAGGAPVVVEVYLDGTLIDRKVETAVSTQARRIVLRGGAA